MSREVGQKAKNFRGSIAKLAGYLGAYKWLILIVWILAIISTIFSILGPKILGKATDELFTGLINKISGTGDVNFEKIAEILLWLAGVYGTSALFSYMQGFVMSGLTARVTFKLRNDMSDKMHKLPFKYYDKTTHGEVLSRITNDIDTISHTLNQSLTQIITSVTSLIGITIMMISISWQLTLLALGILPVSLLAVISIIKKSQVHFKDQQKFLGKVNGYVEENIGNHIIVKAFCGEDESLHTFEEYNEVLYKSAWKANFLSGLIMPITGFVGNLAYVAICILGGYYAANGLMTVGGIQSFIQYVRSFIQPISQIANISNVLQQAAAAAERVFEFLDEEEEPADIPGALVVNRNVLAANGSVLTVNDSDSSRAVSGSILRPEIPVNIEGYIEFDRVYFGYEPDKTVIRDFSAVISPGQKVALVGPTGAGKTTIVKLLMRFYDVTGGSIRIDGHDIREFKRNELRSLFGMVLQDTWLFHGTIADNIKYGKPGASEQDIKKAAAAAQVDHFVRTLPDGYNMILNEEADNISQGQKQLLTIARAILADPRILILDEATSNVDTRTEILIQKAMDNLMKGRTSFIIAHRLSTVRNADLILVINEGDIVEQGTHDELIAKKGFYANLYNSQFEKST